MKFKFLLLLMLLTVLAGCSSQDEYRPVIVSSAPPRITTPTKVTPRVLPTPGGEWAVPAKIERKWTAVIIHHSATEVGNAAIIDKSHREERRWDGIGYDFVIGNGTDSRDGQIETTFRWKQQRTGAHCGGTPGNWANEKGIGICLIGNFDKQRPSKAQLQSLTKLTSYMMKRYHITVSKVYGHGTTPGGHQTECPGRKFPMKSFKATL